VNNSELGRVEALHVDTVERGCFLFTSSSTTTKLRVVFDGSFGSLSGNLINFIFMVVPVVQPDLISTFLHFHALMIAMLNDRDEYLGLPVQQQGNMKGSGEVKVGNVVLLGYNRKSLDWDSFFPFTWE